MLETKVISVGGSIIAPDGVDTDFLTNFVSTVQEWLKEDENRRLILVAGGGAPARRYQEAYKNVCGLIGNSYDDNAADWIGVMATRLNAELLRSCLGDYALEPVIINPMESPTEWQGKILVAAGWKPGFSSDNDAVLLAAKYGAETVINLSNIEKVYSDDPKKNPQAVPLDRISWTDFRKMVGNTWEPGKNTPFDPVASQKAEELGLTVICASGKNIDNIKNILRGKEFIGTVIK